MAAVVTITAKEAQLMAHVVYKPEFLAAIKEAGPDPEEESTYPLAIVAGEGDPFIVADVPAKGMKGYFAWGGDGQVSGVHLGGRLSERVGPPA